MDNIFAKQLDRIEIGVEILNTNVSKIIQRFGLSHLDMTNQHLCIVQHFRQMNLINKLNRIEIDLDMLYKYFEKCFTERLYKPNQHLDTVQSFQEMSDDNILTVKLDRIENGIEKLNKKVLWILDRDLDELNQVL